MEESIRQALLAGDPLWVGWGLYALASATHKGSPDGRGFSRKTARAVVFQEWKGSSRRDWTLSEVARVGQARANQGRPWGSLIDNERIRREAGRVIACHSKQLSLLWAEAHAAATTLQA